MARTECSRPWKFWKKSVKKYLPFEFPLFQLNGVVITRYYFSRNSIQIKNCSEAFQISPSRDRNIKSSSSIHPLPFGGIEEPIRKIKMNKNCLLSKVPIDSERISCRPPRSQGPPSFCGSCCKYGKQNILLSYTDSLNNVKSIQICCCCCRRRRSPAKLSSPSSQIGDCLKINYVWLYTYFWFCSFVIFVRKWTPQWLIKDYFSQSVNNSSKQAF